MQAVPGALAWRRPARRPLLLVLPMLLVLLVLPGGAALAGPRTAGAGAPHPHFDDRGTLAWHATWAEASAAARRSGRLVFLDLGREACSGCRELVEQVLPAAAVRARLARVAVGWAADADRQEPFVLALRREHLPYASMLPMLGFVTPEGRWVAGHDGRIDVGDFLALLARAEAELKARPAVAVPSQPAPALPAPALPAPRVRAPAAVTPAPRAQVLAAQASPPPAAPAARISGLRMRYADGARPGDRPLAEEHAPAPTGSLAGVAAPAPRSVPQPSSLPPRSLPPRRALAAFPLPPPMPGGLSASVAPQGVLAGDTAAPSASSPVSSADEAALDAALALARAGLRAEARVRLEAVRRAAPGTPAGREAQRGLDALGALMQREVGIPPVLHYCCRDRNLLGMQADLLGAAA
ncbi:MAG: thioredoxin family protein, partial [Planctomycetia bacterium]